MCFKIGLIHLPEVIHLFKICNLFNIINALILKSMAYAVSAGLPPVSGLYTTFFHCIIYFVFGTSKHISPGEFDLPLKIS